MADLREVLAQYVPQGVLDDAVEAIKETELAPEWWRAEMNKVAPDAKRARELEAELESIKSAPIRKQTYELVGLKGDLPKFASDWLDQNIPTNKLDDLDFVAAKVKEGGFQVSVSEDQGTQGQPQAAQITDAIGQLASGTPSPEGYEEAVNKAQNPDELDEVYRRFGKPVPTS